MSQPSSPPLFLLHPVDPPESGAWGYYGDDAMLVTDLTTFGNVDESHVDLRTTPDGTHSQILCATVSLETWCNWKFNAKRIHVYVSEPTSPPTITEVDVTVGSVDEQFTTHPIPDSKYFPQAGGLITPGVVKEYDPPIWLSWEVRPVMMIHRGVPRIGINFFYGISSIEVLPNQINAVSRFGEIIQITITENYY